MTRLLFTALLCGFLASVYAQRDEEPTPLCEMECALNFFDKHCGGAICPFASYEDDDEHRAFCSRSCRDSLLLNEEIIDCQLADDIWRPNIDGERTGIIDDIRKHCKDNPPPKGTKGSSAKNNAPPEEEDDELSFMEAEAPSSEEAEDLEEFLERDLN